MESELREAIMEKLRLAPGLNQNDLVRDLSFERNICQSNVHDVLDQLVDDNMIKREGKFISKKKN